MAAERLIGVDIGTQGTKAALFDRAGALPGRSVRAIRAPAPRARGGRGGPRAPGGLGAAAPSASACRPPAPGPAAWRPSAIDGQMAGVIGVGEDGRAVTPYDSWLDTRCAPYIERHGAGGGREVIARKSGGPPSFNHGPQDPLVDARAPARSLPRIRSFVQPGGYAAMRLCGLPGRRGLHRPDLPALLSGFADNPRRRVGPGALPAVRPGPREAAADRRPPDEWSAG